MASFSSVPPYFLVCASYTYFNATSSQLRAVQDISLLENASVVFTLYKNLIKPLCPESSDTFGCGVIWTDLVVDGSYFKSGRLPSLTFMETGFLSKKVLAHLAGGTGLGIKTCIL